MKQATPVRQLVMQPLAGKLPQLVRLDKVRLVRAKGKPRRK